MDQACMASTNPVGGEACWVAGWGRTDDDGEGSLPNELMSVGTNIFSHEYCIEKTSWVKLWPDDICGGIPDSDDVRHEWRMTEGGKGPCKGDSGGPLICPIEGKATLVGNKTLH